MEKKTKIILTIGIGAVLTTGLVLFVRAKARANTNLGGGIYNLPPSGLDTSVQYNKMNISHQVSPEEISKMNAGASIQKSEPMVSIPHCQFGFNVIPKF